MLNDLDCQHIAQAAQVEVNRIHDKLGPLAPGNRVAPGKAEHSFREPHKAIHIKVCCYVYYANCNRHSENGIKW